MRKTILKGSLHLQYSDLDLGLIVAMTTIENYEAVTFTYKILQTRSNSVNFVSFATIFVFFIPMCSVCISLSTAHK